MREPRPSWAEAGSESERTARFNLASEFEDAAARMAALRFRKTSCSTIIPGCKAWIWSMVSTEEYEPNGGKQQHSKTRSIDCSERSTWESVLPVYDQRNDV
jgi:hypothetical protein